MRGQGRLGERDRTQYMPSDYFNLAPGEKPRSSDPYVGPGEPCPKCGHGDQMGWTFNPVTRWKEARCHFCGYRKGVFTGETMPMTEELKGQEVKGGIEIVKLTCPACGREFRTRADNPHGICQRCRNRQTAREWAKEHPEEYRAIQAKYKGKYREKQKQQRMKGIDSL